MDEIFFAEESFDVGLCTGRGEACQSWLPELFS
jgi:hypothetical protein